MLCGSLLNCHMLSTNNAEKIDVFSMTHLIWQQMAVAFIFFYSEAFFLLIVIVSVFLPMNFIEWMAVLMQENQYKCVWLIFDYFNYVFVYYYYHNISSVCLFIFWRFCRTWFAGACKSRIFGERDRESL